MLVSGTLELVGSHAVVVGVATIDGLWWIAIYIIQKSCCISSNPFPLTKFLMYLDQSAIAAITLFACVMAGRVIFLCLKCTVSVNELLLVVFMWHLCIQ